MADTASDHDHSLQSLQTNLLDDVHLVAQDFPAHAVLKAGPQAQQKRAQEHRLIVVLLFNIVTDLVPHIPNLQLYLLLAAQQLLPVALKLPPAALSEVVEVARHLCPHLAVRVVESLPISDQSQAVVPLDVVELATSVYYSDLLVLLLVLLLPFIDAAASRHITKLQCARGRHKPAEDGLVLMETPEVGEEDQVRKVVCDSQIEDVGDDRIADEQVSGQLAQPRHLEQCDEKYQDAEEVDVEGDVARTDWFERVCEGNVLSDDGSVDDVDFLRVLVGQPLREILRLFASMHFDSDVALVG